MESNWLQARMSNSSWYRAELLIDPQLSRAACILMLLNTILFTVHNSILFVGFYILLIESFFFMTMSLTGVDVTN